MDAKKTFLILLLIVGGLFYMPPAMGVTSHVETIQIANTYDDLYRLGGGEFITTGNIAIFYHPDLSAVAYLRFLDVDVPRDAVITSAVLSVYRGTDEPAATGVNSTIMGIALDDCPAFAGPWAGPYVTSYPSTSGVIWETDTFAAGWHNVTVTTPMTEIIRRLGWESGNDLGFMIQSLPIEEVTRAFWDFNYSPALAAKLYISYVSFETDPEAGDPGYYDPPTGDPVFNSTFTYNNQTVFLWQISHMAEEGIIHFYGRDDTQTYVKNGTSGTDQLVGDFEVCGNALAYYDGNYYLIVIEGATDNLRIFYSPDLMDWTLKVQWDGPEANIVSASIAIDEAGIVYAFWASCPSTSLHNAREYDLIGNAWKSVTLTVTDSGASPISEWIYTDVFTTPDGARQYYTSRSDYNLYTWTKDGWADESFTAITIYDPGASIDVRWADVTHYFNESSGEHFAAYIFGDYAPTEKKMYFKIMKADDSLTNIEYLLWWTTDSPIWCAITHDRDDPDSFYLAYSKGTGDITVRPFLNHGWAYNAGEWGAQIVIEDSRSLAVSGGDIICLNGIITVLGVDEGTNYPRFYEYDPSDAWLIGSWSGSNLTPHAMANINARYSPQQVGGLVQIVVASVEWVAVDENGTVIWTGPTPPSNSTLEDLLGPDPDDPDPSGWDPDSLFSYNKTRLYVLIVGLVFLLAPILVLATRPEGVAAYIYGPIVSLLGVLILYYFTLM